MANTENTNQTTNTTFDIVKIIMAILVVGMHTEPLSFNIWLDRGYAIITRFCIPTFFMISSYLFFSKDKSIFKYLKRLLIIYIIWSLIYLPFDISTLSKMSFLSILKRYLWTGNAHALWFLCGSINGFIITNLFLKFFKPKTVFCISVIFLIIGCIISTWAPLFNITVTNYHIGRDGLCYAFPYMSLGMLIAKSKDKGKNKNIKKYLIIHIVSLILLIIECFIFVVKYHTLVKVLWISVLPLTYSLFIILNNIDIKLNKDVSLLLRKLSILIYVSHNWFMLLLNKYLTYISLFFATLIVSTIFSLIIIKLSNKFKFLNYLY